MSKLWIIFVGLFLEVIPINTAWKRRDLFENCYLTFLTSPESPKGYNGLPYFTKLRKSNPYVPIIFHQYRINGTHREILGRPKSPLLTPYLGPNRRSVIFINLNSRLLSDMTIYSYLQLLILEYFHPVYLIFIHAETPLKTIGYDVGYKLNALWISAPIILFNVKFPNQVFIPSMALCDSSPQVIVSTAGRDYNILKITEIFLTINSNLYQKPVGLVSPDYSIGQCDGGRVNFRITVPAASRCFIKSLSQTYNFTSYKTGDKVAPIYLFCNDVALG